ncbi:cadherin-like beta sandwich domain-containing protein [Haliangium sp.]|uniref:cadherin-like beta sandwich domain-containing protein n=1 Tax=Haliangium sp. TaxID=2663208 RepID=UPI003D0D09A8
MWVALVCGLSAAACGSISPVDVDAAPPPPDAVGVTPPDAVAADNADLAALSISAATPLSPAFAAEVTAYTASLSVLGQQVTVSATPVHPDAEVTVNGIAVGAGQPSPAIPVAAGADVDTVVEVEVTAPSGATRTYQITLDRAAAVAQYVYAKASNPSPGDQFGNPMAIDGDTLVVGNLREDSNSTGVNADGSDDTAQDSGAVYVLRRQGDSWVQEAYLKASNTDAGDQFGVSVAISGDVLAVGANGEDSDSAGVDGNQSSDSRGNSGAVYIFRRSGNTWVQEAYLKASNPDVDDNFGHGVALSGNTLAVGAPIEASSDTGVDADQSDNGTPQAGAVYVFEYDGSAWAQTEYIKASNAGGGDLFGLRVALDGDTLAVSAHGEASANPADPADDTAALAGAVYVFERTGGAWEEVAYLKAAAPDGTPAQPNGDQFGFNISLSGDLLAAGALFDDSPARDIDGDAADNTGEDNGSVYVFRRDDVGSWNQEAYIKASNSDNLDLFGQFVALAGDVLAVGANREDSSASGVGGNPDDNSATDSGAVYVYRRGDDGTWTEEGYVKSSNIQGGDNLGFNVALSTDTLAVGAAGEDSGSAGIGADQNDESSQNAGAVYIFR